MSRKQLLGIHSVSIFAVVAVGILVVSLFSAVFGGPVPWGLSGGTALAQGNPISGVGTFGLNSSIDCSGTYNVNDGSFTVTSGEATADVVLTGDVTTSTPIHLVLLAAGASTGKVVEVASDLASVTLNLPSPNPGLPAKMWLKGDVQNFSETPIIPPPPGTPSDEIPFDWSIEVVGHPFGSYFITDNGQFAGWLAFSTTIGGTGTIKLLSGGPTVWNVSVTGSGSGAGPWSGAYQGWDASGPISIAAGSGTVRFPSVGPVTASLAYDSDAPGYIALGPYRGIPVGSYLPGVTLRRVTPQTGVWTYFEVGSNIPSDNINSPLEFRIYYTDADVAYSGINESTLRMYTWDGSTWTAVLGGVDTSGNYVYGLLPHFSPYGVAGQAAGTDTTMHSNWAWVKPTIDGTATGAEWDDAYHNQYSYLGGLVTVDVRTKNDGYNLYLMATVPDPTQGSDWINVHFDQPPLGDLTPGEEDAHGYYPDTQTLLDWHYETGGGWLNEDGQVDGQAAYAFTPGPGGGYAFEFSVPLNDGDGQDLSVSPGETLRWAGVYHEGGTPGTFTFPSAVDLFDSAGWPDLVLAPSPAVTSVATATGTGTATLSPDSGAMVDLAAVSLDLMPSEARAIAPQGIVFFHGLFQFEITGLTPGGAGEGDSVILTITLPSAVPVGAQYYKYGPTPGNPSPHWYTIPMDDNDGDNVITITLTDGGLGDDIVGVADGDIFDQGGVGWPGPSGGGGAHAGSVFPSIYIAAIAVAAAGVIGYAIYRRRAKA
jgi:hypothetical protein